MTDEIEEFDSYEQARLEDERDMEAEISRWEWEDRFAEDAPREER